MNLTTVRNALGVALGVVNTTDWPAEVLPYAPYAPVPPVVYVQPSGVTYDRAYNRGLDSYDISICVLVPRGDEKSAQELLDRYLASSGPQSIRDAIEAARGQNGAAGGTLGGVVDDMHLTSVDSYRWFQYGDNSYLGAEFHLTVIGTGH